MKKVLLSFFMAITTVVAMAQTTNYTDYLVVTVGDEKMDPQMTTITVEQQANETYRLVLKNFVLGTGEDALPVGSIIIDYITVEENNGIKSFNVNQTIAIADGDGDPDQWMFVGMEVPVSLTGRMDGQNLYCSIDIDMTILSVNVIFGEESKVTSINNIAVENGTNVIYDITGREVKDITAAGIYIVNGKKVFVK